MGENQDIRHPELLTYRGYTVSFEVIKGVKRPYMVKILTNHMTLLN